jgi:pimeloyl-ACP methyl ester carboxylesterase
MRRRRRLLVVVAIGLACAALVGVWLARERDDGVKIGDERASAPRSNGLVDVRTITYRSSLDGGHLNALVARPRAATSRGCVIWENGLSSNEDDALQAAQGFAALGLTTVSIDLRHVSRASGEAEFERATSDAKSLAEFIRGTVVDLRSAVDYLENQPYCRRNVAYAGISLGGILGTILAARDRRVKAAVIMSTPGTFRATLTTDNGPFVPGISRDPARRAAALRVLSPLDPARFVGRISPRPVLIVSGLQDKTVDISDARRLQAAAREPKTILERRGGHDPLAGPAASSTEQAVASFLLRHVVEPTYGIAGRADGTFVQR